MIPLDSSVIISFALSCSMKILDNLSRRVEFVIGENVYREIITNAMRNKRYMFQAYRIKERISNGIIKVVDIRERDVEKIMNTANNLFFYRENPIELVHLGESEIIALARKFKTKFVGIDERTTRLLIEDPFKLKYLIESKTHREIEVDEKMFSKWEDIVEGISVVRSVDLAVYAYRKGIFPYDKFALRGILYSLKYSGCSVTEREIEEYWRLYRYE